MTSAHLPPADREHDRRQDERDHLARHVATAVEGKVRRHATEHHNDDQERPERRGAAQDEQRAGAEADLGFINRAAETALSPRRRRSDG